MDDPRLPGGDKIQGTPKNLICNAFVSEVPCTHGVHNLVVVQRGFARKKSCSLINSITNTRQAVNVGRNAAIHTNCPSLDNPALRVAQKANQQLNGDGP